MSCEMCPAGGQEPLHGLCEQYAESCASNPTSAELQNTERLFHTLTPLLSFCSSQLCGIGGDNASLRGRFCLQRSSLSIPSAALLFSLHQRMRQNSKGRAWRALCLFSCPHSSEGMVPCAGFPLPADGSSASAQSDGAGGCGSGAGLRQWEQLFPWLL